MSAVLIQKEEELMNDRISIPCRKSGCIAYLHWADLPDDVMYCPYCGKPYEKGDLESARAKLIQEGGNGKPAEELPFNYLRKPMAWFMMISFILFALTPWPAIWMAGNKIIAMVLGGWLLCFGVFLAVLKWINRQRTKKGKKEPPRES
jgi:hypothetical protein